MPAAAWNNYPLRGDDANEATSLTRDEFEDKVEESWYSCPVDRKTFKALITRSDVIPARYFGPWIFLLAASGAATATATWGTWRAVPSFFVYGVLYSAADHRHHELSQGTPFKTR